MQKKLWESPFDPAVEDANAAAVIAERIKNREQRARLRDAFTIINNHLMVAVWNIDRDLENFEATREAGAWA